MALRVAGEVKKLEVPDKVGIGRTDEQKRGLESGKVEARKEVSGNKKAHVAARGCKDVGTDMGTSTILRNVGALESDKVWEWFNELVEESSEESED